MCGRFIMTGSSKDIVASFQVDKVLFDAHPTWNVAPAQSVPVLLRPEGETLLTCFQWGLIPPWAKDPSIGHKMINARSESVMDKKSFRQAFLQRRCLVIADGFYEWKKRGRHKQPRLFHMRSKRFFAMAGLWERWFPPRGGTLDTFTILTTTPNPLVADVHDRMPVILPPEHHLPWLDPGFRDVMALKSFLQPFPEDQMDVHPVSSKMNTPRYNQPDCVLPVEDELKTVPTQQSLF
ncbi:MAG: hypothetical protein CL920_07860 [Deltaproteobacteria bacterium]|nr:hypothetical protein [Deltaproteobacteria bacterium]MBU48594.1 hypothetical protein [Deltaproteobacteria bacterium]